MKSAMMNLVDQLNLVIQLDSCHIGHTFVFLLDLGANKWAFSFLRNFVITLYIKIVSFMKNLDICVKHVIHNFILESEDRDNSIRKRSKAALISNEFFYNFLNESTSYKNK